MITGMAGIQVGNQVREVLLPDLAPQSSVLPRDVESTTSSTRSVCSQPYRWWQQGSSDCAAYAGIGWLQKKASAELLYVSLGTLIGILTVNL